MMRIPCLTSLDTAHAIANSLLSNYSEMNTELVDINNLRSERMKMSFTKMQGTGNDCIFIECFENEINSPESLSVYLSDRNFGIGSTGVVLILPPTDKTKADAKIRIFNLDGSEPETCGSPLRCAGKYIYDNNIARKSELRVEMISGIKKLYPETQNGLVSSVKVDMGKAEFAPGKVPVNLPGEEIINYEIGIDGKKYNITCLSMGNPHCVIFLGNDNENIDALDISETGSRLGHDLKLFPERVNVEFVKILNDSTMKMRTWERGNGETLSSGTGACAAVAAAVKNGLMNKGEDIRVILKGGDLTVNCTDDSVYVTGDCKTVFEGTVLI
jgi:carbamoyl-phosphate synthase large subunit